MNENIMLKELKEKYEEYLSALKKSYEFLLKKEFVKEDGVLITDSSYSILTSHLNNVEDAGKLIMKMEMDEFHDICIRKENM